MNYEDTILKIKKLENFGVKPGLERIIKLLSMMGNPQDSLEFVHVAGTNGKGSVCFMLESVLREAGYLTGLFISPSIEDFRERIQVNGDLISEEDVCKIFAKIEPYLESPCFFSNPITEFELTTAMAFEYFRQKGCEIVVLETGMGGRLDATNAIKNTLCSVITTISLDHTHFLGDTIHKIALEKFAIIKNNSKAVIGANQNEEVSQAFIKVCKDKNTTYQIACLDEVKNFNSEISKGSTFEYLGAKMQTPLLGVHQKHNISIVFSVLKLLKDKFSVSISNIASGLKKVRIPCRMEVISQRPLIILDASHNPESVCALKDFINQNLKSRNLTAIFCMFKDKDVQEVCKIIGKSFSKIMIVRSESCRAMEREELEEIMSHYNKNTFKTQLYSPEIKKEILNLSEKDGIIVFGSFSIMKEIKKMIKFYLTEFSA